ncbi:MAG: hypothetical protein M3Y74_07245 [Chloroflexota bacterium]|nr:hypothetical protein [Chloroflexota bacterium]
MTVTGAVHIAQAIMPPLVGLALGTLARRALGPRPTRANILWSLSLACACLGLVCWPSLTAALDGFTHVRGLGHLATDIFTSASFTLQFAFTCVVGGRWTWRRYVAVMLYGMLAGLYVALWLAIHNSYDLYRSYSGWPPPVLAINLTLVALIGYAAAIGIYGYAGWLREDAHSSERMVAGGATTVFALASVYAILVLGQTIASLLGLGSTEIMGFTGPITLTAGLFAVVVIWVLTGKRSRRLRAYAQAVFTLRQREVELEKREREIAEWEDRLTELEGNIADLAVWVEDQLIQIHAEVDGRPLDDVATWCAAASQSPYQRKVALTTTRLALLGQARVLRLPRYDLGLLPHEDESDGASMAQDLPREVEDHENFLSDVLRELQMVDPQSLPEGMEPRDEPPGWRRDAATIIAQALRHYGHTQRRRPA